MNFNLTYHEAENNVKVARRRLDLVRTSLETATRIAAEAANITPGVWVPCLRFGRPAAILADGSQYAADTPNGVSVVADPPKPEGIQSLSAAIAAAEAELAKAEAEFAAASAAEQAADAIIRAHKDRAARDAEALAGIRAALNKGVALRIITIADGTVTPGATVAETVLAGHRVPAIIVGEEGRGRGIGILPVRNAKPGQAIMAATVIRHQGLPILVAATEPTGDGVIAALRTPIGFRGGNDHTGDRTGWKCDACDGVGDDPDLPNACPHCGAQQHAWMYLPFPGETLAQGHIAQGDAGRMGWGTQVIAAIPSGIRFRTSYSGRRYGKPLAHYYEVRGRNVLAIEESSRRWVDIPISEAA